MKPFSSTMKIKILSFIMATFNTMISPTKKTIIDFITNLKKNIIDLLPVKMWYPSEEMSFMDHEISMEDILENLEYMYIRK